VDPGEDTEEWEAHVLLNEEVWDNDPAQVRCLVNAYINGGPFGNVGSGTALHSVEIDTFDSEVWTD
jgi:hypothetical protein